VPECIVNDRVGNGLGDFQTPEQFVPRERLGGDFEVCMTLNDHWGFDKNDHRWKNARTVIRHLADIAGKGGNLLLNVGPTAEGTFPPEARRILGEVGQWTKTNGESIYGTAASPLGRLPWGVCTARPGKLYLHVFEWPADGKLLVPGLRNKVGGVRLLHGAGAAALEASRLGDQDCVITLPAQAPDASDSVVVLEIEGAPDVNPALVVSPLPGRGSRLYASAAKVHGAKAKYVSLSLERREHDFIGHWTEAGDWIEWEFRTVQGGAYEVEAVVGADPACEGNRFTLEAGDQKIEGKVSSTGGYEKFRTVKLGTLNVPGPGTVRASVKPVAISPGSGLMNLHAVILTALPGAKPGE
jgi:alpha-L-fucosidase